MNIQYSFEKSLNWICSPKENSQISFLILPDPTYLDPILSVNPGKCRQCKYKYSGAKSENQLIPILIGFQN